MVAKEYVMVGLMMVMVGEVGCDVGGGRGTGGSAFWVVGGDYSSNLWCRL